MAKIIYIPSVMQFLQVLQSRITNRPTNPYSTPPTTSFINFSHTTHHTNSLLPWINPENQTRDSPYAPAPAGTLQTSQS